MVTIVTCAVYYLTNDGFRCSFARLEVGLHSSFYSFTFYHTFPAAQHQKSVGYKGIVGNEFH